MDLRSDLVSLLTALNTVSVKGSTNVKTLASCMTFVENMIVKYDKEQKQDKEPNDKEQAE